MKNISLKSLLLIMLFSFSGISLETYCSDPVDAANRTFLGGMGDELNSASHEARARWAKYRRRMKWVVTGATVAATTAGVAISVLSADSKDSKAKVGASAAGSGLKYGAIGAAAAGAGVSIWHLGDAASFVWNRVQAAGRQVRRFFGAGQMAEESRDASRRAETSANGAMKAAERGLSETRVNGERLVSLGESVLSLTAGLDTIIPQVGTLVTGVEGLGVGLDALTREHSITSGAVVGMRRQLADSAKVSGERYEATTERLTVFGAATTLLNDRLRMFVEDGDATRVRTAGELRALREGQALSLTAQQRMLSLLEARSLEGECGDEEPDVASAVSLPVSWPVLSGVPFGLPFTSSVMMARMRGLESFGETPKLDFGAVGTLRLEDGGE